LDGSEFKSESSSSLDSAPNMFAVCSPPSPTRPNRPPPVPPPLESLEPEPVFEPVYEPVSEPVAEPTPEPVAEPTPELTLCEPSIEGTPDTVSGSTSAQVSGLTSEEVCEPTTDAAAVVFVEDIRPSEAFV
jgi:hypothetical protein